MRLIIDQVFGRLGSRQKNPFLRINLLKSQMNLRIEDPVLTVTHDRVQLSIDNRDFLADLHMYEPLQFSREYAAQAWELARDGVAEMAAEGDRLGKLENGVDLFAAIARENGLAPAADVQLVPLSPPGISFQVIKGAKSFEEGRVQVRLTPGRTRVDLEPGSAQIYVRRRPEIHIRFSEERLDVFC